MTLPGRFHAFHLEVDAVLIAVSPVYGNALPDSHLSQIMGDSPDGIFPRNFACEHFKVAIQQDGRLIFAP